MHYLRLCDLTLEGAEKIISIVIPVFNGEKTIIDCLDSIFRQEIDVEVIICDGLSDDSTLKLVENYSLDKGKKIRVISEKDSGAADAVAKGFQYANGDILGWLGCDDLLAPGALEVVNDFFVKNTKSSWYVGACKRVWQNGEITVTSPNKNQFADINLINCIDQPSSFWRRSLYFDVGGLDKSYRFAFDWDLWCRFNEKGVVPEFTSKILSIYNFSDDNLTSRGGYDQLEEQLRIISKYENKLLSKYFKFIFFKFDLNGYFDRNRNRSLNAAIHFSVKAMGLLAFGKKSRKYSLYWLSKQMRGLPVVGSSHQREIVVITAADTEYFPSLLSLIGTLKFPRVTSELSTRLVIWDLGLTVHQIQMLNLIDFPVSIQKLNNYVEEPFQNAFSPADDCFAWKSYCIKESLTEEDVSYLWMDAGAAVSRNLDQIEELINLDGFFFLRSETDRSGNFTSGEVKQFLSVTDSELSEFQLSATAIGFKNTKQAREIINNWVTLSSVPELVLGNVENHRHDQALLSLLVSRANLHKHPVSNFALENGIDIVEAEKQGYSLLFHRRKWHYVDLNSLISVWKL